jgi:hypothetical protein
VPAAPEFPIVDAHVHIYDPRRISYPWMAPFPTLDRPHLPEDYDRLTAGVSIEAAQNLSLVHGTAHPDIVGGGVDQAVEHTTLPESPEM